MCTMGKKILNLYCMIMKQRMIKGRLSVNIVTIDDLISVNLYDINQENMNMSRSMKLLLCIVNTCKFHFTLMVLIIAQFMAFETILPSTDSS